MKSLLRFANATDLKKGVKNPQKAIRVIKRNIAGGASTAVADPSEYDKILERELNEMFNITPQETQNLIKNAREGRVSERIQNCRSEIDKKPFSLGGANLGGETAYVLTSVLEPSTVLEIGVANGVSTTYILGASKQAGIEPDIRAIDKPLFESDIIETRGKRGLRGGGGIIPDEKEACWVAPLDWRAEYNHQYYVGDFTQILPQIVESLPNLDLVIYDASKDSAEMEMAYDTVIDSLSDGGVLISDDVRVNSTFKEVTKKKHGVERTFGGIGIFRKDAGGS